MNKKRRGNGKKNSATGNRWNSKNSKSGSDAERKNVAVMTSNAVSGMKIVAARKKEKKPADKNTKLRIAPEEKQTTDVSIAQTGAIVL